MTFRVGLIVLSDGVASGERIDGCLPVMRERLAGAYEIAREVILPDDPAALQAEMIDLCDRTSVSLILTGGGTGLGPRDRTPQATTAILDYEIPGIAEAMRAASISIIKTAMLSRAVAGVRHKTLIVNLPGHPKAVAETLDVILPVLPHALELISDQQDRVQAHHRAPPA